MNQLIKCFKKHLKITLNLFILLISITTAFGQPYKKGTLSLSAGAEALFPERQLSFTHAVGAGATAKGEYVIGKHWSATAVGGYYFMPGKTQMQAMRYENITAIPLKAGIRCYFGSFYAAAEAGAIAFTNFNEGTQFVYSFGMGDKIQINNRVLDISLRHEGWGVDSGSNGIIALRVGYEFAVRKKEKTSRSF